MPVPLNSTMITGSKSLQMVAGDQCCASRIAKTTVQKNALSVQSGDTKVPLKVGINALPSAAVAFIAGNFSDFHVSYLEKTVKPTP